MILWQKKAMEDCLGDQAILLKDLEPDLKCTYLENLLKLNSKYQTRSKTLSVEKGKTFFLEQTWLAFSSPIRSTREKDIFLKVSSLYDKILNEYVVLYNMIGLQQPTHTQECHNPSSTSVRC